MNRAQWRLSWAAMVLFVSASASDILMVTMGGTKSHKIPFWELAKGLIRRNHNITFLSAFPADFEMAGLVEVAPATLVAYVRNYTSWDLVGARMRGEDPIAPYDVIRYGYEACDALLTDFEFRGFLRERKSYDLIILDGAYPECAVGIAYYLKVPFMYINTVGFYTASLSISGSPSPYSVTPFFARGFTDKMGIIDRTVNGLYHLLAVFMHSISVNMLHSVLRTHFAEKMPHPYEMGKNVSFILQNGHFSVSYPRAYLPNVAEIACIHCKPAKPLSQDLEDWIEGAGDAGFVYVSMGSSVKAASMPQRAQRLLARALGRLPQRVLWKFEIDQNVTDLPSNIRLGKWLPQQDLLGHKKIKAFVTHGGLLSMYETVYHGVPIVTMPVFCDHDANSAKAEVDGYAKKLELRTLTSDQLYRAIMEVIHKPSYKAEVMKRQLLLRDQKDTPLEKAVYWTEYVIRHKGAYHLQSPARDLNYFQYHMFDSFLLVVFVCFLLFMLVRMIVKFSVRRLSSSIYQPILRDAQKLKKQL